MANNDEQSPADLQRLLNLIQHYTDYQNELVLTPDAVDDILEIADYTDEDIENLLEDTEKQETKEEKPVTVVITMPGDFDAE